MGREVKSMGSNKETLKKKDILTRNNLGHVRIIPYSSS